MSRDIIDVVTLTSRALRMSRDYEILRELGSGGMGTVYLARYEKAGGSLQPVAIKICSKGLSDGADALLDEARISTRIRHPNVVQTLDVGFDESLFLVMEYVEGSPLSSLMRALFREARHIPLEIIIKIAADVLDGLEAAHAMKAENGEPLGLVHRDVTPHNILIGTDGVSRVLDFGIANARGRISHTQSGEVRGKLGYMPSEQWSREPVSSATDTFSMGVVVWEMLAGRRLHKGETEAETWASMLQNNIPFLAPHRADIPPEVDFILARAMSDRPEDRYRSAMEFKEALLQVGVNAASNVAVGQWVDDIAHDKIEAERAAIAAPTEAVHEPEDGTSSGRRRGLWGVSAVALFLLVAGLMASTLYKRTSVPEQGELEVAARNSDPELVPTSAENIQITADSSTADDATVSDLDDQPAPTTNVRDSSSRKRRVRNTKRRRRKARTKNRTEKKTEIKEWWPDDI